MESQQKKKMGKGSPSGKVWLAGAGPGDASLLTLKVKKWMDEADVIILNTCSIRQNAEEKVYGKIGEIKKVKEKNPDLLVGIMGCMAQENKGKLMSRMPIIDFAPG